MSSVFIWEWIRSLHHADTFSQWLSAGGVTVVAAIVFAETGLLFGFFLPGDSLLITSGVLANPLNPAHVDGLSIWTLQWVLLAAVFLGDQCGYWLGRKTGDVIFSRKDGLIFKKKHVNAAHAFYQKHGVLAVLVCRFIPIFRTFVPFIAGVARMPYRKYLIWDIVGGTLWITSLIWLGYFLGQTELANRLDKLIMLVVFVSILPIIIGGLRTAWKQRKIV